MTDDEINALIAETADALGRIRSEFEQEHELDQAALDRLKTEVDWVRLIIWRMRSRASEPPDVVN
jgi:hypothetical protein